MNLRDSIILFSLLGIIHEIAALYWPISNGVAQGKNRTLTELINVMIVDINIPLNFWSDAILTAYNVLKCVPHTKSKMTFLESWKGS